MYHYFFHEATGSEGSGKGGNGSMKSTRIFKQRPFGRELHFKQEWERSTAIKREIFNVRIKI